MSEELAPQGQNLQLGAVESAMLENDLSTLSEEGRSAYYQAVCQSLGLNPLTKPFEYLHLNPKFDQKTKQWTEGKLTLYPTKSCAEQIRQNYGISFISLECDWQTEIGILVMTVTGKDRTGRTDTEIGVVPLLDKNGNKLSPEKLANAQMKASTKAKRRLTFSLAGMGYFNQGETPKDGTPIEVGIEPIPQIAPPPPSPAERQDERNDLMAEIDKIIKTKQLAIADIRKWMESRFKTTTRNDLANDQLQDLLAYVKEK